MSILNVSYMWVCVYTHPHTCVETTHLFILVNNLLFDFLHCDFDSLTHTGASFLVWCELFRQPCTHTPSHCCDSCALTGHSNTIDSHWLAKSCKVLRLLQVRPVHRCLDLRASTFSDWSSIGSCASFFALFLTRDPILPRAHQVDRSC